jgi:hypothetical protein
MMGRKERAIGSLPLLALEDLFPPIICIAI